MTPPPCPYCASTLRYTDPALQVRCTHCFNHLAGTADTPMGGYYDDSAPMVIGTHVYPNAFTKYGD
jgi:hypothetical protein